MNTVLIKPKIRHIPRPVFCPIRPFKIIFILGHIISHHFPELLPLIHIYNFLNF